MSQEISTITTDPDPEKNFRYTRSAILRASDLRPSIPGQCHQLLSELHPSESITLTEFQLALGMGEMDKHVHTSFYVSAMKEKGNALFKSGDFANALACYMNALKCVLKDDGEFLMRNFYNEDYLAILDLEHNENLQFPLFLDLVSCCNNIAQIHLKWRDYKATLDWLQEVEVLYGCLKITIATPSDRLLKVRILENATYRMKAALRFVHIFSFLQNTSSAAYFAFRCTMYYPHWFPPDIPEVCTLQEQCNAESYFRLRHPDLNSVDTWDVKDPLLQVRGIWTKLIPQSKFRPPKRLHGATWIWRSRIYVGFGYPKNKSGNDVDAWCLDLATMTRWRRLPRVPEHLRRLRSLSQKVVVFEDHAWFFIGQLNILRLNMVTEKWDSVQTHCDFYFPYGILGVQMDSYIELYGDKICVLGGYDDHKIFKRRIFIALNLRTLHWQSLDENERKESDVPVPRSGAITWVSTKENRFFLLYGHPNASQFTKFTGRSLAHEEIYSDFWSYDFKNQRWTRERLHGNFPCHRNFAISTYHEKQNKVIIYGGGSDSVPSHSLYTPQETTDLPYSMFGDTFILDLDTRIWQQVVTRDFPAWRSTTLLLVDDDGKIYLHGGECRKDLHLGATVEKDELHFFSDTWRLDVDLPNCHFNEESFYRITPFFKAGCWRRCSACKKIGTGFLRCQGTCGGKYVFCSSGCQQTSWRTHKLIDGCRKTYNF